MNVFVILLLLLGAPAYATRPPFPTEISDELWKLLPVQPGFECVVEEWFHAVQSGKIRSEELPQGMYSASSYRTTFFPFLDAPYWKESTFPRRGLTKLWRIAAFSNCRFSKEFRISLTRYFRARKWNSNRVKLSRPQIKVVQKLAREIIPQNRARLILWRIYLAEVARTYRRTIADALNAVDPSVQFSPRETLVAIGLLRVEACGWELQ